MTNINRVYQFLHKKNNWNEYADKNYGNNDGTVIYSEFRTYIKAEYNSTMQENLSDVELNKLVDAFFRVADFNDSQNEKINSNGVVNHNAFDEKEIANMEEKFALYDKFNEVFNNYKSGNLDGLSYPSGLEGSTFNKQIKELLENATNDMILEGCTPEELEATMKEVIQQNAPSIAADCYAEKFYSDKERLYPGLRGYGDLNGLVDGKIAELMARIQNGETVTMDDIKAQIEQVITNYINEANGTGQIDGNKAISEMAQDRYTKELTSKLLNGASGNVVFAAFPDEIMAAIENYVAQKLSGATYGVADTLLRDLDFRTFQAECNEYTKLHRIVSIKDFTSNAQFKSKLVAAFGSDFVEMIPNAEYQRILEQIKNDTSINPNTTNPRDIMDKAIELIMQNYADIVKDDYGNLSQTDLIGKWTTCQGAVDAYTDDTKKLQMTKQNAIAYCDAVAGKHSSLIKEVLGSTNYEAVIMSKSDVEEIKKLINDLNDKIALAGSTTTGGTTTGGTTTGRADGTGVTISTGTFTYGQITGNSGTTGRGGTTSASSFITSNANNLSWVPTAGFSDLDYVHTWQDVGGVNSWRYQNESCGDASFADLYNSNATIIVKKGRYKSSANFQGDSDTRSAFNSLVSSIWNTIAQCLPADKNTTENMNKAINAAKALYNAINCDTDIYEESSCGQDSDNHYRHCMEAGRTSNSPVYIVREENSKNHTLCVRFKDLVDVMLNAIGYTI